MTTLIIVRHGQTEWNREERFRGRYDIALNETGFSQARATARRIAEMMKPVCILTSPLERARQTAEAIAHPFNLSPVIEPGLIDIDYGLWQGLSRAEAAARWPEQVECWFSAPSKAAIPEGESLWDVRRRVNQTIKMIHRRFPNDCVIAVSHVVVIRMLLLVVLGMRTDRLWDLGQEPCAINHLKICDGVLKLISMNDTCHLINTR